MTIEESEMGMVEYFSKFSSPELQAIVNLLKSEPAVIAHSPLSFVIDNLRGSYDHRHPTHWSVRRYAAVSKLRQRMRRDLGLTGKAIDE